MGLVGAPAMALKLSSNVCQRIRSVAVQWVSGSSHPLNGYLDLLNPFFQNEQADDGRLQVSTDLPSMSKDQTIRPRHRLHLRVIKLDQADTQKFTIMCIDLIRVAERESFHQ